METINTERFDGSTSNRDLKHSLTVNSMNNVSCVNAKEKLVTQGRLSSRGISTKKSLDNNVSMIEFVNCLKFVNFYLI